VDITCSSTSQVSILGVFGGETGFGSGSIVDYSSQKGSVDLVLQQASHCCSDQKTVITMTSRTVGLNQEWA
jgi:hypothetical protein